MNQLATFIAGRTIDAAHDSDIFCAAITPSLLITGSGDGNIKIWSLNNSDQFMSNQATIKLAHKTGVRALDVSKDFSKIASCDFGSECSIWDLNSRELIASFDASQFKKCSSIWALALSPTGDRLAGTSRNGAISLWSIGEDNKLKLDASSVLRADMLGYCIAWSSDGQHIAVGQEQGNVFMLAADTLQLRHSLTGQDATVRCVTFSPCCNYLAAAGDSGVISVYEVLGGRQIAHLSGPKTWIYSINWNADSSQIISASADSQIRIWDIAIKQCTSTFREPHEGIWCIRWDLRMHPQRFVTFGADGAVRWYISAAS